MNKTENTLHKKTPSVTVLSNRGQAVRDIVYHRHPDTPEKTDERITRHQFDTRGFLQQSADPRMQASGLSNFRYITSLSGQVLRTESADAGTSLTLNDAAGRPATSISQIRTDNGQDDRSRAVTQTFRYEGADSAGRPLSITEQTAGQNAQVTERFVYAGNSEAEKAKNLAGVCTHHYDPAGLVQTDSIALTGVPLSITRQLLKDADKPVNWPESNPESLLSAEKYTTQTTADATGAVLNTTDAAGHQQKVTYDIAGLLSTSRVTVKGGTEKIIIKSVTYSAAGQKLREEHGNGVVTTYTYEAQTQRLIAVKTEHPARKKIFQDLRYEYDPVGNVLCVTNSAEETRFWHNQKVVPENRYTYDTLYQLVSATGREMASAGQQSSSLPDISPFDKASYTNYTRNYIYDRAGNMMQVRHSAPATGNNYTTDITVSQRSNRAVLKTLADTPEKAEALFTPGGQQTQLQPGQTLSWTVRGELQQVMPVVRNGAAGDRESYRYDAGSQRILKTAVQKTGNSTQTQQVIYLPGLELYRGKENYQVICAGVAGRAQVRLLHWPDGKKDHQRFSYGNLIGSSGLETDGDGKLLSQEEYYPFGGTAVLVADADSGIDYKTHRYSGKERDATGLYYYGYRYYQPWAGRWLSSDPAGTIDGLNLYSMVKNNPVSFRDINGLMMSVKERMKLFQQETQNKEQSQLKPASGKLNKASAPFLVAGAGISEAGHLDKSFSRMAIQPEKSAVVPKIPAASITNHVTVAEPITATEHLNTEGKKHFTLYRADGRSYEEMKTKYTEGFKAWVPLDTEKARKFVNVFTGSKDTAGLPKHLIENINKWGNAPKLGDLSTYIKYTKDRSTVWVSTAINTEAGGQGSGAPLYEISMDLYESKIVKQKLVASPEGRKRNMEFSLLTDMQDINQSSIIALNHGPIGDEEISFLTRIPMDFIKPFAR
ncbi:RHS repeat protein [Morganella morganii]|uniref:RHS repeat protein n=1 Tax=Morganella morganii TaxID=582 RepID=UPI003A84CA39